MNNGYFPTGYQPAPNPGPGYGQQGGQGFVQQNGQGYAPRPKRAYFPPNWINDISELDDFEVQPGTPLFALFRNKDVFVLRHVDETGRMHDDVVPFEIPRQKTVTESDLQNYVTAKDFGVLVREVQSIREQIGRGGQEVTENAGI